MFAVFRSIFDSKHAASLIVALCLLTHAVSAQDTPEANAIELFNLGQDAHEKGDLNTALDLYGKALKLIPDFPEAELQRGNAFLALGKLDDAETAFRRAVGLRKEWTLALANLGSLLVRRNKLNEAESLLTKAIELDGNNFPAYAAIVSLRLKSNADPSVLRELYKKIAAMTTNNVRPTAAIWASRASLENALGDKKAAKPSATKALELDPKNIAMLAILTDSAIDENDPAKADEFLKRIETIEPNAIETQYLKARVVLIKNGRDEALKFINAIANPSKELIALRDKITAAGETDTAALEKQLETDPKNVVALGRLCSLLRIKEPSRAMDFCRRASDAEPNNVDHAIGYGGALLQAKQYAPAAVLFQRLATVAPDNTTVRANLATALFQLKRYNDAKVQFTWLVEKQPTLAAAYFFLGILHDELGEYADAMANYQLFLKHAEPKVSQLEIDKVNLRLPPLQKQIDKGKGRKNAKGKG